MLEVPKQSLMLTREARQAHIPNIMQPKIAGKKKKIAGEKGCSSVGAGGMRKQRSMKVPEGTQCFAPEQTSFFFSVCLHFM